MAPQVRHVSGIVDEHVDNGNHDDDEWGMTMGNKSLQENRFKIAMSLPPQTQLLIISRFAEYCFLYFYVLNLIGGKKTSKQFNDMINKKGIFDDVTCISQDFGGSRFCIYFFMNLDFKGLGRLNTF